ncbi:uncharacterized protein JN550_003090 [Neoarthrinium moseri]|uniref:uncharacterized protein n=1 Tax=Neoarthrinium moseri TaxID=1658444 RepID=UPI001FDE2B89|nr:uncharacterized protein JN550_003090 [Neoarthrinium moseri]KAI1873821.1 hypothetical protein JN550_003090 [Neoarthrinium moseri]
MAALLLTAVFGTAVRALALESTIPRPTEASIPDPTLQLPEITEPPSPSVVKELLRRADVETVLVAPDNTCGYVSGLLGAAYTCGNTNGYCAFITTAAFGAVACCNSGGCDFRTDCRDREQISDGDCGNGCMNDIYTVKCSEASLPYCGTIRFSSSITDYFCHSLSYSTPMNALTTWIGEADGRKYSQVVVTLSSDALTSVGTSARGSGSATATGASGSSGSSSGDSSGGSSGSSSGGSGGGSSTNIGAIVGGAVGGVAVLALIGFGIWFLVRRSNKNKAAAVAPPPGPAPYPQMQQSPPPGGPSPGPMGVAGHQSVYNPQYPQQPGQQYPSPEGYMSPGAGYFPNQEKPGDPYITHASVQPSSPVSQVTDPRMSIQPSSPTSTVNSFQPQHTGGYQAPTPTVPSTVYEAGGDAVGTQGPNANHRGQFHELS